MEALLEKQRQWIQQQNLQIIEQLHHQNLKVAEHLGSFYQRMTTRLLEVLREEVDEEEEVPKDDFCDEHHSLADAHQVFDKSPSAAEEVVPPLDHLQQPPDRNPLMHVAHHFQQTSNFSSESPFDGIHRATKPQTVRPSFAPPSDSMHWGLLAAAAHAPQGLDSNSHWRSVKVNWGFLCAGKRGWKWTKSFPVIAFDPGSMSFLPKWLLLAMVSSIQSRLVVEKSSLSVTSPESIKGTYNSAIGNFGFPQCGGSMAGTIHDPKNNLEEATLLLLILITKAAHKEIE